MLISDAYFFVLETTPDFLNRIGQLQTFTGDSDELKVAITRWDFMRVIA